jgi:hypothetical protein
MGAILIGKKLLGRTYYFQSREWEIGSNQMNTQLIKVVPKPDVDALILAYWLMFARAPRTPNADIDGAFDLGEVGTAPEKTWTKATPYSLARRKDDC